MSDCVCGYTLCTDENCCEGCGPDDRAEVLEDHVSHCRVAAVAKERDAALASAAALREAIERYRRAFIVVPADRTSKQLREQLDAHEAMMGRCGAGLLTDNAGAALLERLRSAEAERDRLAAQLLQDAPLAALTRRYVEACDQGVNDQTIIQCFEDVRALHCEQKGPK